MVTPPITDGKTVAASGAETEDGSRPPIVLAPDAASPELVQRPRRRMFTAKEKLRILGEADRAAGVPGEVGEPGQPRPQGRRAQSAGGGTCSIEARQPAPDKTAGARRGDYRNSKKPSRNAAACGDRNCRALSWLRKGAAVHFLVASDPVKKHGPWVVADLRVVTSLGDPV